MDQVKNNRHGSANALHQRLMFVFSILIAMGLIWLLPARFDRPRSYQNAAAASDSVIAAAGDIACDPASTSFNGGLGTSSNCRQKYTSDLLVNAGLAAVLDLGDNQYYCGGYQAFLQSYDLSWGRIKAITHPSVGNHEYLTSGGTDCDVNATAAGYFTYFGSAAGTPGQGYYSFDVGSWHIIALNTNCSNAGGCGSSSPQYAWLKADLAAHPNLCTLAYWHIPLFSSGGRASPNSQAFWQLLYDNNADLILNGHDHIYERFAPQTPGAVLDTARGIREFIVGTGGSDHTSVVSTAANSELTNANTFGVMKLTLHATGYDWQFVHEAGKTFTDSGTGLCHSGTADTTPPSAPAGLAATSITSNQVNLSWSPSTDNVGVVGYQVFRNGAQIGTTTGTSYSDATVQAQTTYNYYVIAVDGAGLTSGASNTISVTTPAASSTPTPTAASVPTATATPAGTALPTATSTPAGTALPTATATPIAPDTSITSGPSGSVNDTSATFSFTSTLPNSTFQCSLDATGFSSCASPTGYTGLSNGSHTFRVRAISSTGVVDSTPATRTWTVDSIAPTGVAITSPANGATVTGLIKFSASASDNVGVVSVNFYVDGKKISSDASAPFSLSWNTKKVLLGSHTLYVTAVDAAGNVTQSASITVTAQ